MPKKSDSKSINATPTSHTVSNLSKRSTEDLTKLARNLLSELDKRSKENLTPVKIREILLKLKINPPEDFNIFRDISWEINDEYGPHYIRSIIYYSEEKN